MKCNGCDEVRDDLDVLRAVPIDDGAEGGWITITAKLCTDCRREMLGLKRGGPRQYPTPEAPDAVR